MKKREMTDEERMAAIQKLVLFCVENDLGYNLKGDFMTTREIVVRIPKYKEVLV